MAKWPLIPRQGSQQVGGFAIPREQLPLFYMNDYSCLGLRVDSCEAARQVLAESRYGVVQDDDGCHVTLEDAAEVQTVVALLNDRGVACDIADLVDQVYQG